jgi:hypothetical protein
MAAARGLAESRDVPRRYRASRRQKPPLSARLLSFATAADDRSVATSQAQPDVLVAKSTSLVPCELAPALMFAQVLSLAAVWPLVSESGS